MKLQSIFILLFAILFTSCSNGQNEKKIIGYYTGNGGAYYLLENNIFIIIGYGTFIQGTWNIESDKVILKPKNPEYPFELIGRYNSDIKKGYKLFFSNFTDGETFVGFDNLNVLQRVFNEDANCFTYPYISTLPKKNEIISFSNNDRILYSFKMQNNFNDYVISYYSHFYEPIIFKIEENGLQDVREYRQMMIKKKLEGNDYNDIKDFLSKVKTDTDKEIWNDHFKNKGFKKISLNQVIKKKLKINDKSIFNAKCI